MAIIYVLIMASFRYDMIVMKSHNACSVFGTLQEITGKEEIKSFLHTDRQGIFQL